MTTGYIENIHKDIQFIKGNVQDYSTIQQLSSTKFECIIHIAGQSSGEISFSDPIYDLQTNTQSTLNLLKFSIENGCKIYIRFYNVSIWKST